MNITAETRTTKAKSFIFNESLEPISIKELNSLCHGSFHLLDPASRTITHSDRTFTQVIPDDIVIDSENFEAIEAQLIVKGIINKEDCLMMVV
mgnify:CR=1 FL=1